MWDLPLIDVSLWNFTSTRVICTDRPIICRKYSYVRLFHTYQLVVAYHDKACHMSGTTHKGGLPYLFSGLLRKRSGWTFMGEKYKGCKVDSQFLRKIAFHFMCVDRAVDLDWSPFCCEHLEMFIDGSCVFCGSPEGWAWNRNPPVLNNPWIVNYEGSWNYWAHVWPNDDTLMWVPVFCWPTNLRILILVSVLIEKSLVFKKSC